MGMIFLVFSPQSTKGTYGWEQSLFTHLHYLTKGSSHHPKTPLRNLYPTATILVKQQTSIHAHLQGGTPCGSAHPGDKIWETIFKGKVRKG